MQSEANMDNLVRLYIENLPKCMLEKRAEWKGSAI
jgi:hypothetical protein